MPPEFQLPVRRTPEEDCHQDTMAKSISQSLIARGELPAVFDGNPLQARKFMNDFCCYMLLHPEHPNVVMPAQRVVLCLTLIHGPQVQNWVKQETDKIEVELMMGADPHDDKLWNDFLIGFEQTFCDRAAISPSQFVLMQEGANLEGYIETFNKAVASYGWQPDHSTTMHCYRKGLHKTLRWALYRAILTRR